MTAERGCSADRPLVRLRLGPVPVLGAVSVPAPPVPRPGPRVGPGQRQQGADGVTPTCPAGAGADSAPHRGTAAAPGQPPAPRAAGFPPSQLPGRYRREGGAGRGGRLR